MSRHLQEYDTDGSGYLDQSELCRVVQQIDPHVTAGELRFLLAFAVQADQNGCAPAGVSPRLLARNDVSDDFAHMFKLIVHPAIIRIGR